MSPAEILIITAIFHAIASRFDRDLTLDQSTKEMPDDYPRLSTETNI